MLAHLIKMRKYWQWNSEKVAVMFSTDLMKKHLGNYMQTITNILRCLQIKPTLMYNRYLWKEKFKLIHLRLLDNQVFLFGIHIPSLIESVCSFCQHIQNTSFFYSFFLGFSNLMSPGTSSLSNRCFSYPWCLYFFFWACSDAKFAFPTMGLFSKLLICLHPSFRSIL